MPRTMIMIGALVAAATVTPAVAQTTTCPNLEWNGFASHGQAQEPSLSADGRKVAFVSNAPVLPGPSGLFHIWVRDLVTGVAVRASVHSSGASANGHSTKPRISADGRWVAFTSGSTNLVASDTNAAVDVFVHDLVTGATTRASLDAAGAQIGVSSASTAISADGRFVVFETTASLASTDTNTLNDVYVRDLLAGTTTHASLGTGGASSAGNCTQGSISANGRRVVFTGAADDLVAGDSNGSSDVFLRDLSTGTTQLVSAASSGASGDAASSLGLISGDGQRVAFTSLATNFTVTPTTGTHVHLRDLASATTTMVDVNSAGTAPAGLVYASGSDIGHDGRFVAFTSNASDIVAGDTNLLPDVFVRDSLQGTTVRASIGAVGQQADEADFTSAGSISDDGRTVAFECDAENLLPGDVNGTRDVFVRELASTAPGVSYCRGDGSGAACPCGNTGVTGRGCGHATDGGGAELFAMGVASITNDTLHLGARELPNAPAGVFLQGTSAQSGGLGIPFGDGLLCVGGSLVRLGPLSSSDLQEAHCPGAGQPSISVRGQLPASATTRYYQVWYRSAEVYCTTDTFNLTNAVRIDWIP